jgi:hypothetical protein
VSNASGQECDTGISAVGKVPWGSHFCNFYNTKIDLAECVLPFFKAGLANGEMCFWITSDPLNAREAKRVLGETYPNLNEREASGQITIVDFADWYLNSEGSVTAQALRDGLERLAAAQRQGYSLQRCSDKDRLEVLRHHDFAITRSSMGWEISKAPESGG